MRKTLNRVLACFLSVALLVSCCISGLVLPAAASTVGQNLITDGTFEEGNWSGKTYLDQENGYGGSKAYKLTGTVTAPTFNLSKSLVKDQVYVLRWKIKGGAFNLYRASLVNNSQIVAEYSDDGWAMQQILFTTNTVSDTNTISVGTFYNQNTDPANNPIYLDDFELYEYYPGMNLIPAASCDLVSAPTGHGKTSFFKSFIDAGTKLSTVDDGTGNKVLLLDDVKQTYGVSANVGFLQLASTGWHGDHNVYKAGKVINVSYRYKVLNGATASLTLAATTADNKYSFVECKQSKADENGWVTVNAKITAVSGNATYAAYFVRGGTTDPVDIWVDDIFVGEPALEVTPTIDITEATQTVEEGKTVTLNAVVTPADKAVDWTSSDDTIATVANGVVTGVKAGTVTITAKVADDITDTCTVTVTAKPVTPPPSTVGQNLITDGDFEAAKWSTASYVAGEGYGGGKAFCMASGSGGGPTVTLSENLKENQLYVFRMKVKGGAVNVYGDTVNNAQLNAAYTANGWAMHQFLFTPVANMLNKKSLYLGYFYNKNAAPVAPVYFDDFELYEYTPGMNLMPATDCSLVPAPVGRGTANNDIFYTHISKGTTLSSVDDGTGNKVLKLTGVPSGTIYVSSAFLNNNNTDNNLIATGKAFNISFRYKSAVAGTDAALSIVTTADKHGVVSDFKASAKDENGWITVSAKATVGSSPNGNYLFGFNHSGASDIFIDDFSIKEFEMVNIAENTATVKEGETVTLNATAVPATKPIEWISSDNTIATVANGVVTGVKAGVVTITAKLADDVTDTCTVTVMAPPPPTTATEIVLKDTTLHLAPKAYHVLRPQAGAGGGQVGQINWSSNAEAVATVDANGKVTAVADGTAVITGVSATNPALSVTCTVTVNEHGNRLVGGDFEGEFNPALWQDYEAADGGYAPDPADASNGVLKLNPGKSVYYYFQNGLLEPNFVYTLSGYVKGSVSTASGTGAEVYVNNTMGGGSHYISGPVIGGWITPTKGTDGETWSYFEVTFQNHSTTSPNYTLSIKNHGTSDAYYDNFKLVKRVAPEVQSFEVSTPSKVPVVELGAAPVTLTATCVPNEPDVLAGTLTWESSNTAAATIDAATGVVTAVAEGTTTITVKNENGKQGTLELRVVQPATGMVITDVALHLVPKAYKVLAVEAIPSTSIVSAVTWESSNEDVAKVDENGKVTAVADGIATITATNANNPSVKASITVTVDEFGNRIIGGDFEAGLDTYTWTNFTSDKAEVVADPADPTNHVLKLGAGKSGYYLFRDGLLESNSVYVLSGRVKGAVSTAVQTGAELYMNTCGLVSGWPTGWINPTKGTDGQTWGSFAVTIQTPAAASWAYTLYLSNFGSVDSYYDDIKLVKRTPPAAESLAISAENNAEIIVLGDTPLGLTVSAKPTQIDVVVGELTWTSSNPAVATVSKTGDLTADVTAVAEGEATITVQNAAGVKATYTVKVMKPATQIDITENTYTFGPEGMHGLTVNALPEGTYYGNLDWSSDNENVVTVENGVIKGVAPGTAIITATSAINSAVTDTITVVVTEYGDMLTGGNFEDDTDLGHWDTILNPDGKAGGSIIVDPDNANNHVLTFKPNPSPNAAYYQYAGNYKLLQLGPEVTYVLTGRIKGDDKPAIGLNQSYVEHTNTSGTAQWNHPEGSKEEWKEFSLVFKTKGNAPSAQAIGSILSFGNFGVGTCLFDDLKLAKQAPQTITGLTMLKEEATYGVGVTTQMNYTTTPENNADLSTLQWSSSNESVATVDQNGKVTTLAAGKTTITLKSSDTVKATCELTVVEKATSFVLSKESLALISGATDTLTTITTPYGAAIPGTLTWGSSDNAVATVANGVVTAVADGTATITCTNGTLSASCTVKVSAYGELIIGGDFQDETLPQNWNAMVNGTAAEVVDDPLVDGNRYLVVKAGQTTSAYTGLALEADTLYMLTLRAKGYTATVNVNSSAVATFYPSAATARQTVNDANKWNTLTLRFRTKTEGTLADVLSFAANQYGDTFIDDISLVKVPALTGISLSVDSNEIAPNNSLQLTAKPIPSDSFIEGRVNWTTSDTTILSVSDTGRLLAGKEGNATITATVEGFAPATLDMKVTYYAPLLRNGDFADSEMEPWWSTKHSLKFSQFEVREGIGENGSNGLQLIGGQNVYYNGLDMVLIPNNVYKMTVRYKSKTSALQGQRIWSNFGPGITLTNTKGEWKTIEKVFTVASNWLPGSHQVSILADTPAEEWEEVIIDSIDVRMFDSGVDATLVTLNPPATTLTPGQSLTYMMATTPSDANTNFMTWTSSNPDVVTVDNGTILAVGGGEATITATVPTSTGSIKAVATVTVEGEKAIIKNGSFDVQGDNSWTLTDATIQPEIGISQTNALVFSGNSAATQTITGMKAGTVYIARVRSNSIGQMGASIKIKSADGALTYFNSSVPTLAGWKDSSFEFVMPDNYDGSPLTFELATSGAGTSLYLDNVSITEGYSDADLIVSDIMWNDGATQMKPGTPVNFTVVIGNIGSEATKANRDIVVEIRVNTKTIRTFVHKGGIPAGEMIALTTDPNDPWLAEEGELVVSAHVNTTLTVLESNSKNNGTQSFIRVSDNILEAPQLALNGGFNSLVFSDDFDTANVDTGFTGDYGYKWYMTDLAGMSGDKTDFHLTGDSTMILEGKNMHHNWLLCTMDAKTGAGWLGFTHGYLEFRTRFDHNPEPGYTGIKAPAIWSFPPEAIATSVYPRGEVHVEMDWMEYWGDQFGNMHWTVTMHEQSLGGAQWMVNHGSYAIRGEENDIGDGEWHTVGYRWEKGIIIAYLDGEEITRQTWGPDGGTPSFNCNAGEFRDNAMMQMDNQTSALILAATKGWPLEIDYIRVWQADGTVESKPILDSTFLEDYLSDENGDYFLDVNADNYEAIIDAMDAWLELSEEQQNTINAALVEKGGKEYAELLFEAQTLLQTVETFVSFYACDEYGDPYTTVDETNYEWILTAAEEWDSLTDVEREAINNKVLELCGMTFEDMLAAALNFGEGGGEGNEEEIPSPEDGVPFPAVALVGLVLGGAAMIAGKKRRDEE